MEPIGTISLKPTNEMFTTTEKIIFSTVLVAMIGIGVFGNGSTIGVVMLRRFRLRTPANFFVLNLAIADFAISVISNSTHLANIWTMFMNSSPNACRLLASLCLLACAESLFTLTAIAVFRFIGVSFRSKNRAKVAGALIAITWLLAIAFAVSNVIAEPYDLYSQDTMTCLFKFRADAMAAITLLLIICCFVVITCSYSSLVIRLVRNKDNINSNGDQQYARASSESQTKTSVITTVPSQNLLQVNEQKVIPGCNSSKHRLLSLVSNNSSTAMSTARFSNSSANSYNPINFSKTVKTVAFIVGIIYILWIPTFVIQALLRNGIEIPYQISMIALLLGHASSSVNFIVYAVFNKFYRDAIVELFSLSCPCFFDNKRRKKMLQKHKKNQQPGQNRGGGNKRHQMKKNNSNNNKNNNRTKAKPMRTVVNTCHNHVDNEVFEIDHLLMESC